MTARVLAAVLALALALVLAWNLWQRREPAPPVPPTAVPVKTATATSAATVVPGYRLAGTAMGLHGRYAVFENPDGGTDMYKVGDDVPGLGTLARVGEVDATVNTSAGEVRFQVRPAPTKVPENTPTARRVRKPSPLPDPSESESSPSDEQVPPAS